MFQSLVLFKKNVRIPISVLLYRLILTDTVFIGIGRSYFNVFLNKRPRIPSSDLLYR